MTMLNKLKQLGLSNKEAEIYFALAKEGVSSANRLAKITSNNRTVTYNILQNLLKKGLISFIKRDFKRVYQVLSYETLLTDIKEKESLAKQVISELKKLRSKPYRSSSVEIFEGLSGLKTINHSLIKSKDLRVLNSTGLILERLEYSEPVLREILKNKREIKIISNINSKIVDHPEFVKNKKIKTKYIPSNKTNYATTFIFNNTVIIQVIKKGEPLIIRINDKYLYEGYKMNFDMMWDFLK